MNIGGKIQKMMKEMNIQVRGVLISKVINKYLFVIRTFHKLGPSLVIRYQKPTANSTLHGEILGATKRQGCPIATSWEALSFLKMHGIQI